MKEVPFNEERKQEIDKNKSLIADFFDRKHVYNTFRIAFIDGKNRRRIKIIMLMIVVMVVIGPILGNFNIKLVHEMKNQLCIKSNRLNLFNGESPQC